MTPNLIHPISIAIRPLLRATTVVDEDYREEYETVARGAEVIVPGQLRWLNDDYYEPSKLGPESHARGYVLFRTIDLTAANLKLRQGDLFTSFGTGVRKVEVNVFIIHLRYMGHYPDLAGPGLVRAYFQDRHPAKPPGEGLPE